MLELSRSPINYITTELTNICLLICNITGLLSASSNKVIFRVIKWSGYPNLEFFHVDPKSGTLGVSSRLRNKSTSGWNIQIWNFLISMFTYQYTKSGILKESLDEYLPSFFFITGTSPGESTTRKRWARQCGSLAKKLYLLISKICDVLCTHVPCYWPYQTFHTLYLRSDS